MPTSRREMKVLETYARSLLEAGKTEGRVFQDLKQLEALASMTPELLEVLKALVERDQLDLLPRIAELYRTMTEEDDDILGLTVTTAVPLDDELRAQIKERYEKDFGKKVFLIENVDPSIIGGIVFEARGQRRDISVKTQLRAARDTLASVHLTHAPQGGDATHV
ncbi:FoF1 ATP synthase subunit delta [uncultured Enorma sp.]|jgi:F-type H+-transporting ATPase subunit delta|uniref:F0F1 ATP synthase subunit delta n=2 Tax=Enorma TaxID=1472762 RepID=UPI0025DF8067|nr:F0F1 ATP synthase subunit delta [uncultured Enorma sp.]